MMLFENEQILVFTEDGETKVLSKAGGKVLNISDAVKKIANANGYHKPVIHECHLNAAVIDEEKQKRAHELSVWNGLYPDSVSLFIKRSSSFNPESSACTKVKSPFSDLSPNECVNLTKKAKDELELRIFKTSSMPFTGIFDFEEDHVKSHREVMNLRKCIDDELKLRVFKHDLSRWAEFLQGNRLFIDTGDSTKPSEVFKFEYCEYWDEFLKRNGMKL